MADGGVKYVVTIGAQTIEVEVGGVAREAQLSPLPGTPLYLMLLAGDSWTVAVEPGEGPGRWALGVVGERVEVEALDEHSGQPRTEAAARAGPTGSRTVTAPMPGLVVRIDRLPGGRCGRGSRRGGGDENGERAARAPGR